MHFEGDNEPYLSNNVWFDFRQLTALHALVAKEEFSNNLNFFLREYFKLVMWICLSSWRLSGAKDTTPIC